MRWPRMLLLVAVALTLAFAARLWAATLQPRSIVVLPRPPLFSTPPPPHLTAPRIIVPASPSVAAHLGLTGSGGGHGSTVGSHSGGSSSTGPKAQTAGTPTANAA